MTDVPADPSSMPALPRPQRPEQRSPNVRVAEAPPLTVREHRSRWMRRIAVGSVPLLAALTWFAFRAGDGRESTAVVIAPPVVINPMAVARVPGRDTLQRLPRTFLEQPVDSESIVWLLAGGADMNEWYEGATTLIATAMARLEPGRQQFGLYLVSGQNSAPLRLTVADEASVSAAINMMKSFRPVGEPDLVSAFRQVLSWKPATIFFVVSQPTDDSVCNRMIQEARNAQMPVSLLIVGDKIGWARLALETRGEVQRIHKPADLKARVDELFSPAAAMSRPSNMGAPDESGRASGSPGAAPDAAANPSDRRGSAANRSDERHRSGAAPAAPRNPDARK